MGSQAKTMLMGVVDVGETMAHSIGDRTESKLSIATKFFASFVLQRMLASKPFEAGLVTYGDSRTDNFLNKQQPGVFDEDGNEVEQAGYENVVEVVPLEKPSDETFQFITNVSPSGLRGDLIDGMVVGQDILLRANQGKAYNRILVLMTDGETRIDGVDDLDEIMSGMLKAENNFSLYVLMLGKVDPR
jgi:hypothetical protein